MDYIRDRNYSSCDVLIVGAGPAGTAAAILLSRQGFSVTVIDKEVVAKGKICGDLLGPRAIRLLEGMDLVQGILKEGGHYIHEVRIFDEKGLIGCGVISPTERFPAYGIAIERVRLDLLMRNAAEESGATILGGIRIEKVERPGDTWIYSQGISERGERWFRSRMVLGADGVHSRVAKQIGLFQRIPNKMILAARSYFHDVPDLCDAIEIYFVPELFPGYGWVIPVGTRRANIGIGIRADVCLSRRMNLRRQYYQFIQSHTTLSRRLKEAKQFSSVQGWSIGLYGQAQRNYAPHILLLGDAGNFADPISGEGIYGALESAHQAAVTCSEAFQVARFDGAYLSRYEGRWKTCFHEDFHYADRLVSLLSHKRVLSSLVLWGIRRMSKRGRIDEEYAKMVTGFFCGVIPRREALQWRFLVKGLFG
jgi:geranylgeranyl reductase family protein